MEKNIIKQRLDLIDKLLESVNSREEYLYLLGQREAFLSFLSSLKLNKPKARSPVFLENIVCPEIKKEFGNGIQDFLQTSPDSLFQNSIGGVY